MARTGVLETVQRIRRQLKSAGRNEVARLDAAMNDSQTTLVFEWAPQSVRVGDVLNVDLELLRVISYDSGTRTATVIRGWLDSTAAAHLDAAEVLINARFTNLDAFDALTEEISSWGPQLYRVAAEEFTIDAGYESLELPAAWSSMYGLVRVHRKWEQYWQDTETWPEVNVRVIRSTTDWTDGAPNSGLLVRFLDPVADGQLMILAALPWSTASIAIDDDLITDVGLSESLLDMLAMGVKIRLAHDGEWARMARNVQDEPRRAEETPLGAAVQPLQFAVAMYRNRKQEEINKLRAQHPIRYS